jgi:RNA polymerase sigma-70 factor (ECF subfamily)
MPAQTVNRTLNEKDRVWFASQVDELLPELYGRALRLCRHQANAEDLAAEAVAKAWESLPGLENRDAFRAWVFRILNNAFMSMCRSAQSKAEHESLDAIGEKFSLFERLHQPILLWWGSNPEQDFLNRLLRADLARSIDGLPSAFRAVVVMVDVQGMAYREVADLLAVPIGTVRSRLARGRSLLQEALWMHGREAGLTSGRAETHTGDERHDDE